MSIGEEQTECPLCMEPLEMDDINFFPCTCGYQICRFCWHRIRTDENGLCPACRKQYPEDPAEFKPLTEDELQRIKKERRQKDLQRKQKAAENRKHLANVRVVQKNLVFVVGLSQRLADPEVLKKAEYFGKFGKMHKVVINHSTSYAGAQGPSASAYVTYNRPEDALKAIQAVNNIYVDGRTLKASLGTTKYCSHFLRGAQCPKNDCMYLHELGEEQASFTKEEMQQGKHQEYEQRLYEMFMNSQNLSNHPLGGSTSNSSVAGQPHSTLSDFDCFSSANGESPVTIESTFGVSGSPPGGSSIGVGDTWPSLAGQTVLPQRPPERLTNGNRSHPPETSHSPPMASSSPPPSSKQDSQNAQHRAPGHHRSKSTSESDTSQSNSTNCAGRLQSNHIILEGGVPGSLHKPLGGTTQPQHPPRKPAYDTAANSMSLFSDSGFSGNRNSKPVITLPEVSLPTAEIPDTIAVSSTTDWQAAFGFTSSLNSDVAPKLDEPQHTSSQIDDDLGFDPWNESAKALADLMEKEEYHHHQSQSHMPAGPPMGFMANGHQPFTDNRPKMPPGFSHNHIGAYNGNMPPMGYPGSKMLGLMPFPPAVHNLHTQNAYHENLPEMHHMSSHTEQHAPPQNTQQNDVFNMKDWQEGLRALLPNINISFGNAPSSNPVSVPPPAASTASSHSATKNGSSRSPPDLSWDPAIVTSGNVTDSSSVSDEPPHWMASLQHLTEDSTNHRLPFLQQVPFTVPAWPPQTAAPPPGFHGSALRGPAQMADTQTPLAEGLQ